MNELMTMCYRQKNCTYQYICLKRPSVQ